MLTRLSVYVYGSSRVDEDTRKQPHSLRSYHLCWCDGLLGAETAYVSVTYCYSVFAFISF